MYKLLTTLKNILSKSKVLRAILHPIYVSLGIKKKMSHLKTDNYIEKAPDLLKAFKDAMDETKVDFWLEFGTLLGAYREQNFIKHDFDIDVGVMAKDYSKNLEHTLEKHGFKLKKEFLIDDGKAGREQTYEFENVTIDIFYFHEAKDTIYCHAFISPDGLTEKEAIKKYGGLIPLKQSLPKISLKNISFLDLNFKIPKNTKEHLAYHYGDDFMTPNAHWDYTDTVNDNKNAVLLKDKIGVFKKYF